MTEADINYLKNKYILGEDLSPTKPYSTFVAYTDNPNVSFIIKEFDNSRSSIYKLLQNIFNPYIATTYCIEQLTNSQAVITEHVYGQTLTEYITQNGTLSAEESLDFCIMLADALISVHNVGIIHKDITPNNIIVTESNTIKLIDFGIAREIHPINHNDTEILGTRGFVAPEIRSDMPSSYTADIYSVGCILNYILTGEDPGTIRYRGKQSIENILEHTIIIDPNNRYQNAKQLKKALILAKKKLNVKLSNLIYLIPGFRSASLWKMIIAITGYNYFILFNIGNDTEELITRIIMEIFWLIFPFFMITNKKIIKKILPPYIYSNFLYLNLVKFISIVIAFFVGYAIILLVT